MALIQFPDPKYATPEGIIAVGGALTAANLRHAYRQGIFPWPMEGWPLTWFCPPERAILEFADLHVPRSFAKWRRKTSLRCTIDAAFPTVIERCARAVRPEQDGTWITPQITRAYVDLHRAGVAHSVEVWEGENLVGGLYGVDADGAFAGESMFYLRPNASKLGLIFLIEHLRERGAQWLDAQVMTPHMRALGAKAVPRDAFLQKLAATRARQLKLF